MALTSSQEIRQKVLSILHYLPPVIPTPEAFALIHRILGIFRAHLQRIHIQIRGLVEKERDQIQQEALCYIEKLLAHIADLETKNLIRQYRPRKRKRGDPGTEKIKVSEKLSPTMLVSFRSRGKTIYGNLTQLNEKQKEQRKRRQKEEKRERRGKRAKPITVREHFRINADEKISVEEQGSFWLLDRNQIIEFRKL